MGIGFDAIVGATVGIEYVDTSDMDVGYKHMLAIHCLFFDIMFFFGQE